MSKVDEIRKDEELILKIKILADDETIKLYQGAEILNLSRGTLSRVLDAESIEWRSVSFKVVDKKLLYEMAANPTNTIKETAKLLEVSVSTIHKNLEYFKVSWVSPKINNNKKCDHEIPKGKTLCIYCSNQRILQGFNDLQTKNPKLAKEWDAADNSLKSYEVVYSSSKTGSWKCSVCQNVWDNMSLKQRSTLGQNCPYCSNKRLLPGFNDLGSRHPELISLWSKKNENVISEIIGGAAKYWWVCSEGHETFSNFYKRLENNCGICSGHKVEKGSTDFATVCKTKDRLDLLDEWDFKRNKDLDLTPNSMTAQSNIQAWWICKLGHSWFAQIGSRWTRGCPGCGRKRLEKGFNDLKSGCERDGTLVHLLKEWDEEKNLLEDITMESVTIRSARRAWWKCKKNHSWSTLISNRTAGDGCPKCRESKLEQSIELFIKELGYDPRKDRKVLEGLEIDLYIPNKKIGFEVNGNFWHSDSWVQKTKSITAESFHKNKKDLAMKNGVDLYFIWESDWHENKDEIKEAVLKVLEQRGVSPILEILSKG